jgi:hypothetical protein
VKSSGAVFFLEKIGRLRRMSKKILKAIEYVLAAAGLLIGIVFVILIIRGI